MNCRVSLWRGKTEGPWTGTPGRDGSRNGPLCGPARAECRDPCHRPTPVFQTLHPSLYHSRWRLEVSYGKRTQPNRKDLKTRIGSRLANGQPVPPTRKFRNDGSSRASRSFWVCRPYTWTEHRGLPDICGSTRTREVKTKTADLAPKQLGGNRHQAENKRKSYR